MAQVLYIYMDTIPDFPCTACGACCRSIHLIEEKYKDQFEVKEDGKTCVHLGNDNKCTIYNDRPEICKIKGNYMKMFLEIMPLEDYYKATAESCKQMQILNGIGEEYRVKIN